MSARNARVLRERERVFRLHRERVQTQLAEAAETVRKSRFLHVPSPMAVWRLLIVTAQAVETLLEVERMDAKAQARIEEGR